MGTTKTLSCNELRRITGVSGKQYKTLHWHNTPIVIKSMLTISEYVQTVRNIIQDCKAPDESVAVELIDFAIRANIVSAYAFVELPKDLEELYYIIYSSDIYDLVCSTANKAQIESIKNSVQLYIGG